MNFTGRITALLCMAIAVVSVAVPYLFYQEHTRFSGAFLFWIVFTIATGAAVFTAMASWRSE